MDFKYQISRERVRLGLFMQRSKQVSYFNAWICSITDSKVTVPHHRETTGLLGMPVIHQRQQPMGRQYQACFRKTLAAFKALPIFETHVVLSRRQQQIERAHTHTHTHTHTRHTYPFTCKSICTWTQKNTHTNTFMYTWHTHTHTQSHTHTHMQIARGSMCCGDCAAPRPWRRKALFIHLCEPCSAEPV